MVSPSVHSHTLLRSLQVDLRPALLTNKEASAEVAEPVGTHESRTSHIPNTDLSVKGELHEDQYPFGVVFLLKYAEDGPCLDAWVDVSPAIGTTGLGIMAAEKLTGKANPVHREVAISLNALRLRARIGDGACRGPYLIRLKDPITPDELEQVLRSMEPTRRKAFLKGARL